MHLLNSPVAICNLVCDIKRHSKDRKTNDPLKIWNLANFKGRIEVYTAQCSY